jgi:hypothetical protein
VFVNPNPTISVTPGKLTICKGETHTLTASGASSYVWSTTGTTNIITVKPTATTLYTVTGTDANGCSSSVVYQALVNSCNAITENQLGRSVQVFPNPSTGDFSITSEMGITLKMMNSLGQLVRTITLNEANQFNVQIKDLSGGVYFLVGENEQGKVNQRIVIGK